MVKFLVFVCFLLLSIFALQAQPQNLVPNPSFEEHSCCPCYGFMFDCIDNWYVAKNTPDYFNACNNTINNCTQFTNELGFCGVPQNFWGTSDALDGKSYAGFAYIYKGTPSSVIESFGVELLQPLLPEITYCFSFWLTLADSSNFTTKKISVGFSETDYIFPSNVTDKLNIVEFDNQLIFDSNEWIEISGSFTAKGFERYLIFGNFIENDTSQIISTGNSSVIETVYLYIDMINLFQCDSTIFPEIINIVTPNNDGINDYWSIDEKYSNIGNVEIFNRWGNIVYQRKYSDIIKWDASKVSPGVYFYIVQSKNDITNQKRGTITVIGGP